MYKLYTDKSEQFICDVQVKNASLKGCIVRLILESDDGKNLIFVGKLEGNKCIVPIKKLKGVLEENTKGKMYLEIIVEDIYFKPWKSDFLVEEHTSMKVSNERILNNVNNRANTSTKVSNERILNNVSNGANYLISKKEIKHLCEHFNVNQNNISRRKNDFLQILNEYFKINPEYKYHKKSILRDIRSLLK